MQFRTWLSFIEETDYEWFVRNAGKWKFPESKWHRGEFKTKVFQTSKSGFLPYRAPQRSERLEGSAQFRAGPTLILCTARPTGSWVTWLTEQLLLSPPHSWISSSDSPSSERLKGTGNTHGLLWGGCVNSMLVVQCSLHNSRDWRKRQVIVRVLYIYNILLDEGDWISVYPFHRVVYYIYLTAFLYLLIVGIFQNIDRPIFLESYADLFYLKLHSKQGHKKTVR